MQPKISIIIPTKNAAATLEAAITSVLSQDCDTCELIVIDGDSRDGTIAVIRNYEHTISSWISEPDNGIYDAMRKGTERARGDFVYFLGADDTLCPGILEKILPLLADTGTIYYGDAFLSVTREVYDGPFDRFKILYDNICMQAIFYPASVFRTFRFNGKYPIGADYELNLRLFLNSDYTFEYLPFTIARFSQTGISAKQVDSALDSDKMEIILANASFPLRLFFYGTYYVPGVRRYSDLLLDRFRTRQKMKARSTTPAAD